MDIQPGGLPKPPWLQTDSSQQKKPTTDGGRVGQAFRGQRITNQAQMPTGTAGIRRMSILGNNTLQRNEQLGSNASLKNRAKPQPSTGRPPRWLHGEKKMQNPSQVTRSAGLPRPPEKIGHRPPSTDMVKDIQESLIKKLEKDQDLSKDECLFAMHEITLLSKAGVKTITKTKKKGFWAKKPESLSLSDAMIKICSTKAGKEALKNKDLKFQGKIRGYMETSGRKVFEKNLKKDWMAAVQGFNRAKNNANDVKGFLKSFDTRVNQAAKLNALCKGVKRSTKRELINEFYQQRKPERIDRFLASPKVVTKAKLSRYEVEKQKHQPFIDSLNKSLAEDGIKLFSKLRKAGEIDVADEKILTEGWKEVRDSSEEFSKMLDTENPVKGVLTAFSPNHI
ncbi:MAG: hypothetical protein WB791_01075, partial [Waddliaceae bacterium]